METVPFSFSPDEKGSCKHPRYRTHRNYIIQIRADLKKNLYREHNAISQCCVDADTRRVPHPKWNVIHQKFRFGVRQKLRGPTGIERNSARKKGVK